MFVQLGLSCPFPDLFPFVLLPGTGFRSSPFLFTVIWGASTSSLPTCRFDILSFEAQRLARETDPPPAPLAELTSHYPWPTFHLTLSPFLFPRQPRSTSLCYLCPECILSFLPSLLLLRSQTHLNYHLIDKHFLFFLRALSHCVPFRLRALVCSTWNRRVLSMETGSSFNLEVAVETG